MTTRTAEPRTHRRLTVGESGYNWHRGTDSWECACGAWGSHSWMGWAYHLSDLLAEAAAPAGLDVDALTRAIMDTYSEFGRDHSLWQQDSAWKAFAERVAARLRQGKRDDE